MCWGAGELMLLAILPDSSLGKGHCPTTSLEEGELKTALDEKIPDRTLAPDVGLEVPAGGEALCSHQLTHLDTL